MEVKLVYIGDHFYNDSGSMMSMLYTEDGARYDYGFMACDLRDGKKITIRQATVGEQDKYEAELKRLIKRREK